MSALSIEQLLSKQNLPNSTTVQFMKILKGGIERYRLLDSMPEEDKEKLKHIISEWLEIWFKMQIDLQKLHARLSGTSEKEATYEFNHSNINEYIRKYVISKGAVPAVKTIAEALKLHRATVTKHLADSKNATNELVDSYKLITRDIVGTVAGVALRNDDVKAAKVYMDIMHKLKKDQPAPTHVQMDDFVITQPMMDKLTAAQKNSIKELLKSEHDLEEADVQLAVEVKEETPALEEKKVDDTIYETAQQPILNKTEEIKENAVREGQWINGVLHKTTKQPAVSREEKVKERVPVEKKEDTTKYKDRNGGPTLFG